MAIDVVLEGPLPHDFIVAFSSDPEDVRAVYYGQEDIFRGPSESSKIKNWDIQIRVKSGFFHILGGGTAKYLTNAGQEDTQTLVIGGYGERGAVPLFLLGLFQDKLLEAYQKMFPNIKEIRLEPDESNNGGGYNLERIAEILQKQISS